MTTARCLCGSVNWELGGPFSFMSHCHCSRCRKAHGAPFATYVGGPLESYKLTGEEHMATWESRCFCGRCGSVVPGAPYGKLMFVPAGNFDDDPGPRPEAHILVGSKAPWFEITDSVPQFDTYPEGMKAPVLPDRAPLDPPGKPRGSCLCASVNTRCPTRSTSSTCFAAHAAPACPHRSESRFGSDPDGSARRRSRRAPDRASAPRRHGTRSPIRCRSTRTIRLGLDASDISQSARGPFPLSIM